VHTLGNSPFVQYLKQINPKVENDRAIFIISRNPTKD
jgi:hypothetical protein